MKRTSRTQTGRLTEQDKGPEAIQPKGKRRRLPESAEAPRRSLRLRQKQIGKQHRNTEDDDTFDHSAKHPRHNNTADTVARINHPKAEFIEKWLDTSRNATSLQDSLNEKPEDSTDVPLTPHGTGFPIAPTSSAEKSEKSGVSVHDADFRTFLTYRNIYIERQKPSIEFMQRAKEIVLRPRLSPEIDEATAQDITDTARRLQTKGEQDIRRELAPQLLSGLNDVPDPRLARASRHVWGDAVPIPLRLSFLAEALPLPSPAPGAAFGYSEEAFSENQLDTIVLLAEEQSGRSYAMPDKRIFFPFLSLEFISQANGGTHYVATNQVANAGSIAMNAHLELMRRSLGVESLNFNEPQCFSVSLDHEYARINVHWLGRNADGQVSFHLEALSKHIINDVDNLRAFQRAVKNILDYNVNERLSRICEALDAYRQKVLAGREQVVSGGHQATEVEEEPQKRKRRRRKRKGQA